MSLLQWCSLRPQGPSNLAAIRFSAPIQITSLRVFPKGARPFKQAPDVVAETEPEAFFLDIFFNAQALQPGGESKEKQRAPNALVPTSIAYAGGQMDFAIDMGTEYATRLMIIKGNFEVLSMAIYGHVVAEKPPVLSYEPKTLPIVEPFPLSRNLDPANSTEPRALAEKLLALIPNPPRLPLVVRLMFCLKPSDEDWDDPEFPDLYADLEDRDSDFDLEGVVNSVSRPIPDDLPQDTFLTLVDRVNDFLGPKDNDHAYWIAKLLSIAAPQQPEMARTLLENLNMEEIFDEDTLEDETTILCLFDACANSDIANHFNNQNMLGVLENLRKSSTADQYVKSAARKLEQRILGWRHFEDAFTNEAADFQSAAEFIIDLTSEENSTGIWLSCMLLNSNLVSKLSSAFSDVQQLPPSLTQPEARPNTTGEFLVLVRAIVGVVSVLSAWSWADSLGVDHCRERILAVLSIWQDVEGYSDILNHLLYLRQLTRRLGWIISDSDPPRKSGIFAERILMRLAESPRAILQEELYKIIIDLKQPLSVITEDDRLALRKNAFVAEDGLPSAVEELLFTSDRPFSLRRLRTLRVSVAIIQKEIKEDEDNGELRVLNNLWEEEAHGLIPRLVDLVHDISDDITKYFDVNPMLEVNYRLLIQLFDTARDTLGLLSSLTIGYPLTSRSLRTLTTAVVNLRTCITLAVQLQSPRSTVVAAALSVKGRCLDILAALSAEGMKTEVGSPNAFIILRTLLSYPSLSTSPLDPVYQVREVLDIIEHILPPPASEDVDMDHDSSHWVTTVLPKVLTELTGFVRLLDLDSRLQFVQRLVELDNGVIGVGEWLLTELLKGLVETIQDLSAEASSEDYKLLLRYQAVEGLEFLWRLSSPESPIHSWLYRSIGSEEDLSSQLAAVFNVLLHGHYTSPSLTRLVQALAKEANQQSFPFDLRISLLLHLLRIAQVDPNTPGVLDHFIPLLQSLPSPSIPSDAFPLEVGLALAAFSRQASTILDPEIGSVLMSLLEWCMGQENKSFSTLKGLKTDDFSALCDFLSLLELNKDTAISDIQARITIDEDEVFAPPIVELQSEDVRLSLNALQDVFNPNSTNVEENTPSTPRAGNKTPDILGTVISPPTALLRSPAATGLTKTYANNDFRQLRQVPSARLNTSRLPSMHGLRNLLLVANANAGG
ncbi:hypothetical protein CC1G_01426 [Coprinopsis cinerea okayama7|uniref:Virilizer N-terminal domain-containing protein n=1 Tax=Coprinopsis cinerea (strain Okayama-7 / 130 / ATCC MYA-4618 / FGSC 9003) TaxID=240176 RepID=A8NYT1_COPC7|nr:hypothetical protein CC1G_01426 [Coprinopsis cinerea okayama7\|eukprot:XP_001837514.1 hypothetical protein CC1G_01426 [Coprinopsis cinerea okayama7\